MEKPLIAFIAMLLLAAGGANAQVHNIRADSVISPQPGRTPVAIGTPITIRFTNTGVAESNVPVAAWVRDSSGVVIYRDTVIIGFWPGDIDTSVSTFASWVPLSIGSFTVCGASFLPTDQDHSDDSICSSVLALPLYDAEADSVINPQPNEVKAQGSTWEPIALFRSVGVADLFDVPAFVAIYRLSDSVSVFRSDTTITALNVDQGLFAQYFRPDVGPYHISALPPGCYRLAAYADYQGDGNRSNDTAWTTFCISSDGVSSQENSVGITIFPDPADENLNIWNIPPETRRIILSDDLGQRLIESVPLGKSSLALDLSRLPAATYFISIDTPSGLVMRRVVKK